MGASMKVDDVLPGFFELLRGSPSRPCYRVCAKL